MDAEEIVEVTDITPRGGVARLEGKAVFIPDTVPGDIVKIRLLRDKERYFIAELREVVTPSPHRISSTCPHFPACGSCDALFMDVDSLRQFKLRALKETLARFGGISPSLVNGIKSTGDYQGSRNKITFHLEFEHGKAIWGFHRRGDQQIIAVDGCFVEEAGCRLARKELFAWADPTMLLSWGCKKVIVRAGVHSRQTVLFLPRSHWQSVETELQKRDREPTNGIWLTTPEGKRWELASGEPYLGITVGEITYQIRGGTFFQVHTKVAALLLKDILESFTGGKTLLDLYCGMGFFSLPAANQYERVSGIETDQEAVVDGRHMIELMSLTNIELLPGKIEERLPNLGLSAVDTAIIDPPRGGMEPKALESLLSIRPRQILYVSCHPATLARDLIILQNQAYQIEEIIAYDMFPPTLHLEVLAKMRIKR